MSNLRKVFVYGTLKRGEPNHGWFSKSNGVFNYVGEAKTVDKYPLIIGTQFNIPFLLHSPGNGAHVKGELYEVDEEVFRDLDVLEEHPKYYQRHERHVRLLADNSETNAWIYFIMDFKEELLEKTTYESYSNAGEHGLKYVGRYLRGDVSDYKKEILKPI